MTLQAFAGLGVFPSIAIVVFLGLAFGSFATALVYRTPRGLPWGAVERSRCPSCGKALEPPDLIPIFSWLWLRGQCRQCSAPIGVVYPLTEVTVLAGCLGVYLAWGFSLPAFILMACVPFLVALLVIDLQHMILPDRLVAAVAVLGLARLAAQSFSFDLIGASAVMEPGDVLFNYILGGFVYAGLVWVLSVAMTRLRGKDVLGFGDVKFFGAAGFWLGLDVLPSFLFLSGLFGLGLGLLWKIMKKGAAFPFGPALIAAFYLLLILDGFHWP